MKKLYISFILFLSISLSVLAQDKATAIRRISMGLELGIIPNYNNTILAGASLQYESPLSKSVSLSFLAGYLNYFDALKAGVLDFGIIPLKVGGKYYFHSNLYATGEIGVAFSLISNGGSAFMYSPGLGISDSINAKSNFDLGLRYERLASAGSPSYFALRAAYAFGL